MSSKLSRSPHSHRYLTGVSDDEEWSGSRRLRGGVFFTRGQIDGFLDISDVGVFRIISDGLVMVAVGIKFGVLLSDRIVLISNGDVKLFVID